MNNKKQSKNKNINSPKKANSEKSKQKKEKNKTKSTNSKSKKSKESKSKKKNNKKQKKSKQKENKKINQNYWKKLEFKISQFSGKIIKNYKKLNFPKNLNQEDIDIILNLLSKKSKKFAPVRSNTQLTFIFMILLLSSLGFGVYLLTQKKVLFGVILIVIFLFLGIIYLHKIRKSIDAKYKKCHKDIFYLTDYINRRFLAHLGYYLLVDYNFKSIGIYLIPFHIWNLLQFRDKMIDLKKNFIGCTIDQMHRRESYIKKGNDNDNVNDKNNQIYNDTYNKLFKSTTNYFGFGYNYINKFNLRPYYNIKDFNSNSENNNEATFDDGDNGNDVKIKDNIKFNNFFKKEESQESKDNKNNKDISIDVNLKSKKDLSEYQKEMKIKLDTDNMITKRETKKYNEEIDEKLNENKYEELNSRINSQSIDNLNDFRFNGLGVINKYMV